MIRCQGFKQLIIRYRGFELLMIQHRGFKPQIIRHQGLKFLLVRSRGFVDSSKKERYASLLWNEYDLLRFRTLISSRYHLMITANCLVMLH